MKKKILTSILAALIVTNMSLSTFATTNTTTPNSNYQISIPEYTSENLIKDTISNYFNSNLESEKQQKPLHNEYILADSSLSECNTLTYKLKAQINKAYDLKLESYSSDIKVNYITFDNDFIKANVDLNVRCQYNSSDDITLYSESHIVYLKQVDNKLLICNDISNIEGDADELENSLNNNYNKLYSKSSNDSNPYEFYTQDQINLLNDNLDNIYKFLPNADNTFNNSTARFATPRAVNYNRSGAAKWAKDHAFDTPEYSSDCTNYVSKAIHYGGGIPKDYSNAGWYQLSGGGTHAWIRVTEFWEWLVCRKGYACDYMGPAQTFVGDIVQFKNKNSASIFTHTVIVTERRASLLYVCSHTRQAYNVPITNFFPSSTYDDIRYLTFV